MAVPWEPGRVDWCGESRSRTWGVWWSGPRSSVDPLCSCFEKGPKPFFKARVGGSRVSHVMVSFSDPSLLHPENSIERASTCGMSLDSVFFESAVLICASTVPGNMSHVNS